MSTSKHIDKICCIVLAFVVILTAVFIHAGQFGVITVSAGTGYEQRLFNSEKVHTIDLVMDDWEGFLETCENEEYELCSVVIDQEAYNNVGIRAKGNTSLSMVSQYGNNRYSFKIEFDHYDSTKTYYGLDKLSLNNIIQDNTYMKDFLSYQMMGDFGVSAPLCSYAYLTINGEDWGLYLAVEGVEESFLQRNYGNSYGELYKPDQMDMGGGRGNGGGFDPEKFQQERDTQNSGQSENSSSDAEPPDLPASGDREIPDGMPQTIPDAGDGKMPEAMPDPESGEVPEAMPDAGNGEIPGAMPDAGNGEIPGAMPDAENREIPGAMPDAGNGEVPGAMQDSENAEMPDTAQKAEDGGQSDGFPEQGKDRHKPGGFPGNGKDGRKSDDVSLIYTDDKYDSYSNIFENAKTDITDADKDRLIQSLKAMNEGTDLENTVDTDQVIRYFVVHNFVCNFDSYTGSMIHNYYLYEENGRMSMIPWDYNLAFGGFQPQSDATGLVNYPIDTPVSGGDTDSRPMLAWILNNEPYTELYHQYFAEFISSYFTSGYFTQLIDSVSDMIAPYVEKDPTKFCTYEQFETGTAALKQFCLLRAESIQGQLDGTVPSTSEGQAQNSEALIDASDITISDMGSMGRGMGGRFSDTMSFQSYETNF